MPTIVRSGGGGGADISALTNAATTDQVLEGHQFYGAGSEDPQTGTIKNNGAVTETAPYSGSGYYSSITINTTGDAEASHVLSGKTFMNSKGEQTGSMVNRSSKTTINVGETGGAGYYSSISINKSSLGTAKAEHVLNTVTFTNNNGSTQSGTMVDKGSINESLSYGGTVKGGAGYYSSINIIAPSRYGTATQAHVLNNVSFMNSTGNYTNGTIATYGATTKTINPGENWSGAGYYSSIKITANAATYYGNATNSRVLKGYTFMNSKGTKGTGTYVPAANYLSITTADVNDDWTSVTFSFTPVNYAVGWNQESWNHSSSNTKEGQGTHYGLKHYQDGASICFCKEGTNSKTFTARIIAYA